MEALTRLYCIKQRQEDNPSDMTEKVCLMMIPDGSVSRVTT